MQELNRYMVQGTDEWNEFRRKGIGSSDAPKIMEASPPEWGTRYELWERKLGLREEEEQTYIMTKGHVLEEAARKSLEDELATILIPKVLVSKKHPWLYASVDGMSLDHKTMSEIKFCGEEDYKTALSGRVPDKYYPQCQHQMIVAREAGYPIDSMWYYAYVNPDKKVAIRVAFDEEYAEELFAAELAFYRLVQDRIPPERTDRDHLSREDQAWATKALRLKEVRAMLKEIKAMDDELTKELKELSGGHSTEGFGVKVTYYTTPGSIDYKAIPELQSVDLNNYRKPESRTCRLTIS